MLVYRDAEEIAAAEPRLAACATLARRLAAGRPSHDDAVGLLIELGVLEAGVADALFPQADGRDPVTDALHGANLAAGRLVRLSWRGGASDTLRHAAGQVAEALERVGPLPPRVGLKVPEGYAYYALYPETYLVAAERFAGAERPERAVCLGIRSIGTSLSAVVAAGLEAEGCAVQSLTLRPRGHPFDRRPVLLPELERWLAARADSWFLIVDEGPGLSGSSFAGVAAMLVGLGVPDRRILLLPSHCPDPASFCSATARERWPRHRKLHVAWEEAWLPRAPFGAEARDLSGGAWRTSLGLPERDWPAVQPWHERRKYLVGEPGGPAVLHKSVGLGRYGVAAWHRAQALAEAGFGPEPLSLSGGFLAQRFIPGRPLTRGEADAGLVRMAGRYFRHLATAFALDAPARPLELLAMLRVNVAEGLGEPWSAMLDGLEEHVEGFGPVPAVALDGRVLPQEWLATAEGYVKLDALDHHADHFYPGTADIAWDVAAFASEFDLPDAAVAEALGDPRLPDRLPLHAAAYLAFRLGYTTMAAGALAGSPDGARMEREATRYRDQLRTALRRLSVRAATGRHGRAWREPLQACRGCGGSA